MYDFHQLSPTEFEELVRDLLQAEFGIRLETFAAGADMGIDCRFSVGEENIIVQAKHYLRSGTSKLLRALRAESTNIERLKPSRYIIATSLPMTPAFKEKAISALPNAPLAPSDVMGQEDLNNLLRRHSEVEIRHTKLWLHSSTILRQLIRDQPSTIVAQETPQSWRLPPTILPLGRAAIMDAVLAFMRGSGGGTLLLLGAPAIGKTTIALAMANSDTARALFGQRRCFVQLDRHNATDAVALKSAMAEAVGFPAIGVGWQAAMAEIASAPCLLILDNLETTWEADPDASEDVLADLANIQGLVVCCTLRGSERPAKVRWSKVLEVARLSPTAAAELFVSISGCSAEELCEFQSLVEEMDGVPLAIELLAEQAQFSPPADLRREWQRRKTALLRRAGRKEDHLSSLAVSIALSLASPRTTAPGRRLFNILGRLPGGCTSDSLAALMGEDAFPAASGLRRTRLAYDRGDRLLLLSPVREYAAKRRLPRSDECLVSRHFMALLEEHSPASGVTNSRAGVDRLLQEQGNLDAALRLALRPDLIGEFTQKLLWRLSDFQRFSGAGSPDLLLNISHTATSAGQPTVAAQAILRAGEVYLHRARYEQALKAFLEGIQASRATSQPVAEATCVKCTGDVYFELGLMPAACSAYRAALKAYRQCGSQLGEANCWYRLASMAIKQDRLSAAARALSKARSLYEKLSDILGSAHVSFCAGEILLSQGEYSESQKAFDWAAVVYRKQGYVEGEGRTALAMASLCEYNRDITGRVQNLRAALKLFQRLNNPYWLGEAHFRLSLVVTGDERASHRNAAWHAWSSIGRTDLLSKLASC
ncbi:MAG TPA: restriction endonuclease [Allosphingosinicella sp.]